MTAMMMMMVLLTAGVVIASMWMFGRLLYMLMQMIGYCKHHNTYAYISGTSRFYASVLRWDNY